MKRYWEWFKYLTKHRWFVFLECCKVGIPVRGLIHDIDKYLPKQFIPYARFHFNKNGSRINRRDETGHYDGLNTGDKEFEMSLFLHWRKSKHHWESWCIPRPDGNHKCFPMDDRSILEMICDWKGAGKANGTPDVIKWYKYNGKNQLFHLETREKVEKLLGIGE
jgi:hypothetical protein